MLRDDQVTLYQGFWSRLLERLTQTHPGWPLPAARYNWVTFPAGYGLACWSVSFTSRSRLRSELYFPAGSPQGPDAYYQTLIALRGPIDRAYGSALSWEPLPRYVSCRIADYRTGSIGQHEEHDSYIAWFTHTQERLREAIGSASDHVTWLK